MDIELLRSHVLVRVHKPRSEPNLMSKKTGHKKQVMPPRQAIGYAINQARESLKFLKELDVEIKELDKRAETRSGIAWIRAKQQIIADAFAMYVNSLFDPRRDVHSLRRSYQQHIFLSKFQNHELVEKCKRQRNERSGHQSQTYGFFLTPKDILLSDIDTWLSCAEALLHTGEFTEATSY